MSTIKSFYQELEILQQQPADFSTFFTRLWDKQLVLSPKDLKEISNKIHAIAIATEYQLRFPKNLILSLINMGMTDFMQENYNDAIIYHMEAIKLAEKDNSLQDEKGLGYFNLGVCYRSLGETDLALKYLNESLLFFDNSEAYPRYVSFCYYQIGELYMTQKHYQEAKPCYKKAYKIAFKNGILSSKIRATIGIGNLYLKIGNYPEALYYLDQCLDILYNEQMEYPSLGRVLHDKGEYYFLINQYTESLIFFEKALKVRLTHKLYDAANTSTISIANVYIKIKSFDKALDILLKMLSKDVNYKTQAKHHLIHKYISQIYTEKKDYNSALIHYQAFHKLTEKTHNEHAQKKLKHLEIIHQVNITKKENDAIKLKNQILETTQKEILWQKNIIERKNNNITQSINYASKIQKSLLPTQAEWLNLMPESFILYLPRDIVSGDFYWVYRKNEHIILVTADCTGHGVPGALLTVLGISLLNHIIEAQEFLNPAQILNQMNIEMFQTLNEKTGDITDTIDITICGIDTKKQVLYFSGARNPLIYFQKGELFEIKGDRYSVGQNDTQEYTSHVIPFRKNMFFYTFSDGYKDQFGGKLKRKFLSNNFKKLLMASYQKPVYEQKNYFYKALKTWQGDLDQIDDILLVGFSGF